MDEIVAAALKKWPNVPHCYGWLALDARGDWYMRDDRIQAAGPFPRVKGSRIEHEKLREFIERNYARDDERRLVLPERAAARLRRARGGAVGLAPAGRPGAAAVDRHEPHRPGGRRRRSVRSTSGRLFLATDLGFGIVHTLDMDVAADAVERGAVAAAGRSPSTRWPRASAIACSPAAADGVRRIEKAGARPACSGAPAGYFAALTM